MRISIALVCLFFLAGCETISHFLPEAGAAKPAAQSATQQAPSGAITPVRSEKALSSFKIEDKPYADEAKDFGTPPVSGLINPSYHGATPTTLAGGKLIDTHDLLALLSQNGKNRPVVINALSGTATEVMTGSVWLSGAGSKGRFNDDTQTRLAQHLDSLTNGNKKRTVVFYCLDLNCWLSYNAALRAVVAGYRNVLWYRGGLRAWYAAGLPSDMTEDDNW